MPLPRVIENVVDELELTDFDAGVLREIASELRKDLDQTRKAVEQGNLTGARQALREVHHDCREAIFALRALRLSRRRPLSSPMTVNIKHATVFLEQTADQIVRVLGR
jgi:hypothetical protein